MKEEKQNVKYLNRKFWMQCPECGGTYWKIGVDAPNIKAITGFECLNKNCRCLIELEYTPIPINSLDKVK